MCYTRTVASDSILCWGQWSTRLILTVERIVAQCLHACRDAELAARFVMVLVFSDSFVGLAFKVIPDGVEVAHGRDCLSRAKQIL